MINKSNGIDDGNVSFCKSAVGFFIFEWYYSVT